MDNIRPIGPPVDNGSDSLREKLKINLADMKDSYSKSIIIKVGDQATQMNKNIEAVLTKRAWEKAAEIEMLLTSTAKDSASHLVALPTFVRISTSLLKLAVLIASTRQEPNKDYKIEVVENDIVHAAFYIQKWGVHTVHMIKNSGKSFTERTLDRILKSIRQYPGITRSEVMRRNHLTSQEAFQIFNTLEERGLVNFQADGRGKKLYPL
jgi:ribosomal protein S25